MVWQVINTCQTKLRHNLVDHNTNLHHCENLTSHYAFQLVSFVSVTVQILRHQIHSKLSFFTCNLLSCILLSPVAFVISAFRLFILQLTSRCSLLYLATNIRLLHSLFLFRLFAEWSSLQDLVSLLIQSSSYSVPLSLPIVSFPTSFPLLISVLVFFSLSPLSSYHGCLIAFIDQQHCFLVSSSFCFQP